MGGGAAGGGERGGRRVVQKLDLAKSKQFAFGIAMIHAYRSVNICESKIRTLLFPGVGLPYLT